MKSPLLLRLALVALTLFAAACSTTSNTIVLPDNPFKPNANKERDQRLAEDVLYKAARQSLDDSDYGTAITRENELITRFPFSEYATQAELERIYAYYRNFQPDQALTAADRFLRDHPRHPAVDYVQYLKGLVNSDRDEGLAGVLGLDTTKEDVGFARTAFDNFAVLVQKYPNSRYDGDARQRMIYLRNRIAQHEMHIVTFYMRRGAYIAAAKRAEEVVMLYPGAPATLDALRALEISNRKLGLNAQADDARSLLEAQAALPAPKTDYPVPPYHPGFFKRLFSWEKAQASAETAPPPPAATPKS
ncbi:MAG: outer membrane protein assembly factor BamD [Stenotrophobium sp.]